MPDILTLGAMKAYALGRRAKWKDYVDLYFIIKHYSIKELIRTAKKIFVNEFNEKLFREELSYFKDIHYSEKIDFMPEFELSESEIREKLIEFSLTK
jgi:negative regulator of genetic competence, sporulation and motility